MESRVVRIGGVAALVAAMAGQAAAQSFVNGDFETNDLSGWTVVNTMNGVGAPGSAVAVDIDGPGPLGVSPAATFMVGLAAFAPNSQGGIEMTQTLQLESGVEYTFDFDWSAQRLAAVNNAEGGIFSLIVDGVAIGTVAAGGVSSTTPQYGHLTATFTPSTTGAHEVGLRITRPFQSPGDLSQYVDNITVSGGGGPKPCYANCDDSTAVPILNVNDFVCFQQRFAAGDSYANCDGSSAIPVLNVNDFVCFQQLFAAGCP